jgi:transposase
MQTITTIGLDIAKSVFQIHGVDANGQVVIRRQLKRRSVLMFFSGPSGPFLTVYSSKGIVHYADQLYAKAALD